MVFSPSVINNRTWLTAVVPGPPVSVIEKNLINYTQMTFIVCHCNVENVRVIWNGQICINPALVHCYVHVLIAVCAYVHACLTEP